MVHVVRRLYSAAFDLPPRREPPGVSYMIATTPRSGSTHFCIQMWRTGVFGAPMEYINLGNVEDMVQRLGGGNVARYWEELQRVRTTPNGVFGYKAFVTNFEQIGKKTPELLPVVASDHVILLTRRDRISQAVSYARAAQTRVWFKGVTTSRAPEYRLREIRQADAFVDVQIQGWERLFKRTRVKPLRIFHEDVIADFPAVAARISETFGVSLDAASAIDIPGIEEQSDGLSAEWKARYVEDRARQDAGLAEVE